MEKQQRYDDDFDKNFNEKNMQKPMKKKSGKSQILIVIQLIISGLILLSAFIVKTIGGSVYAVVGTWFYDNYNNSILTGTQDNVFSFVDQIKTTEKQYPIFQSDTSNNNSEIISKIKSDMHKPLKSGTVTSEFGNRGEQSDTEFHKGIDISANKGDEIFSILDGTVTIAEKIDSYGNYIVITHTNNIKTLYAHCSELCVKQGDKINAGQKIALVGSTGDSDGNHLHLEIIINNENINPRDVLGKEYT